MVKHVAKEGMAQRGIKHVTKGVKRVAEEGMAQLGVKHVTQGSDCVSKEDVTMEETSCHKGRQNMLRSRASRRGVQHVTGHFLQESGMSQGTSAGTSRLHAGSKTCCQTRLAPGGGGYYTSPGTLNITQHFLHKGGFHLPSDPSDRSWQARLRLSGYQRKSINGGCCLISHPEYRSYSIRGKSTCHSAAQET